MEHFWELIQLLNSCETNVFRKIKIFISDKMKNEGSINKVDSIKQIKLTWNGYDVIYN